MKLESAARLVPSAEERERDGKELTGGVMSHSFPPRL